MAYCQDLGLNPTLELRLVTHLVSNDVCLLRGCRVGEERIAFSSNLILLTLPLPRRPSFSKAQPELNIHTRAIFSPDGVVKQGRHTHTEVYLLPSKHREVSG